MSKSQVKNIDFFSRSAKRESKLSRKWVDSLELQTFDDKKSLRKAAKRLRKAADEWQKVSDLFAKKMLIGRGSAAIVGEKRDVVVDDSAELGKAH